MKDKQPQTCYVPVSVDERLPQTFGMYRCIVKVKDDDGLIYQPTTYCQFDTIKNDWTNPSICGKKAEVKEWLEKINSVYIHTPEELAQAFREVAEKAIDKGIGIGRRALIGAPYYPSDEKYIEEEKESYLSQHYPSPQPINTNEKDRH